MKTQKAENIVADLKRILIMGIPFSGKTTLLATIFRPLLVFATDATTLSRLAGQKDIEFVICYDEKGELPGSGIRRFDSAWKELLCMKTIPWKSVGIDTFNYFHEDKLEAYKELNPKDTRNAYGQILSYSAKLLKQSRGFPGYFVVLSHVRLKEDETTGKEAYLPSVQGATKDSMAGRFDAALYTEVTGIGKNVQYKVRFHPDIQHICGVKVPIGKEGLLEKELPFNLQEIIKLLRS